MFILIFSEPIYRYWFVRQNRDYSKGSKELDSLLATWNWKTDSVIIEATPKTKRLLAFNPNQASKEELMQLGFSAALAQRVVNYRAKGGKFLVKSDLMKIYGFDSSFYRKLDPLILLPQTISKEKPIKPPEFKEKPLFTRFDLNKADTSQLIRIYGIGPKLSQRIVAYREKLGGFISDSQLKEVYGLDSTVVKELVSKSFIEENFLPKQININTATEKELGSHPYIKYKLARAMIAYRMQHGAFNSADELKKIVIMDEKSFLKMRPYVAVQ